MVTKSGKETYATALVVVEDVTEVEEDVVAIRIEPKTPGTVFIS